MGRENVGRGLDMCAGDYKRRLLGWGGIEKRRWKGRKAGRYDKEIWFSVGKRRFEFE